MHSLFVKSTRFCAKSTDSCHCVFPTVRPGKGCLSPNEVGEKQICRAGSNDPTRQARRQMPMRTNVWGAPQGTARHRFPKGFQLQTLAMALKKLYNGAHAVRPQAVV